MLFTGPSRAMRPTLGGASEDRAGDAEDRRQRPGQALPVIAAVVARVYLAVARADVHALGFEAVRVQPVAVDTLVIAVAWRR